MNERQRLVRAPQAGPVGRALLEALAEPATLASLRRLGRQGEAGDLRRAEPEGPRGPMRLELDRLLRLGAVEPAASDTPASLTELGSDLLEVADVAAALEAGARDRAAGLERGARVLALLGDGASMTVVRSLAEQPLDARRLWQGAVSDRRRSTAFARRLSRLIAHGFVQGATHGGGELRLSARGHMLAIPQLLAMWAERDRLDDGVAGPSADVLGALRLLAPAVAVPAEIDGCFVLHQSTGRPAEANLCLRATGGRIRPVPVDGTEIWGFALAPAGVWLRALMTARPRSVMVGGDQRGIAAVVRGLAVSVGGHQRLALASV